ncbi:MAG TPA: ParB/RepB/Spo0J family partition protein [Candidatus Moranbacteria bacterium]|nr:ParB/RepB/Spo0J family partition protein [Candidatus Moranbacteria bacterium]
MAVKRGLGKGLDALFENTGPFENEKKNITEIKVSLIEPNRAQPRKSFDEEQLKALSDSIKEHGLIQPIVVMPSAGGFYKLVAGERRWRAAKMAGMKTIPAIVRECEEKDAAEIALIENLQREDLNPCEEAEGYLYLMEKFNMTQEQVGERLGKSRSAIANAVRLLSLPENILSMVREGLISGGHARAILSLETEKEQQELAERIIKEKISVREAEKEASGRKKKTSKKAKEKLPEIVEIESIISSRLGTRVKIKSGEKKGKIEIEYYGTDDLCRILEKIAKV